MIREMNIAEVRKNFSDIVNEVRYKHDNILLHKSGKPVAALIDIELFRKVQYLRTQLDSYITELSSIYNEVPNETVVTEIEEAIKTKSSKI